MPNKGCFDLGEEPPRGECGEEKGSTEQRMVDDRYKVGFD